MAKNQTQGQKAFHDVFIKHAWGDRNNAGKNYKRKYNKTKKSRGEL
ncbi:hypothetical protein [Pseudoalteromonas phage J2-1_QLiu-2017]|nr:hypothetical protein [Pseudoalteromonas phage J2-1_QLiu-2017]